MKFINSNSYKEIVPHTVSTLFSDMTQQYLIGDIGGTNLRLCIFSVDQITKQEVFSTTQYPKLEDAIKIFLQNERIDKCCLAIAGPVEDQGDHETVIITNQDHQTEYSSKELSKILQVPVKFLNDFEAIGYYLTVPHDPEQFHVIQNAANPKMGYNVQVYLGAGSGLGFSYLFGNKVFAAEGGHVRFPVENEFELEFFQFYKNKVSSPHHLSNDRVISGAGIRQIHQFLTETRKTFDDILKANNSIKTNLGHMFQKNELNQVIWSVQYEGGKDLAAQISHQAQNGDKSALIIMAIFFAWYGRYAADATVMFNPQTVYITGGIILKNLNIFLSTMKDVFLDNFNRKGRLTNLTKCTEVKIILNEQCGLLGCKEACQILLQ